MNQVPYSQLGRYPWTLLLSYAFCLMHVDTHFCKKKMQHYAVNVGWHSVVSVATRYGLDGAGIESRWGQGFPHLSTMALGPTQPPIQWLPGLSWGYSGQEHGVDHAPHVALRLTKEESYTYTPHGPLWSLIGLHTENTRWNSTNLVTQAIRHLGFVYL
jgi:hypothetical protein